MNALNTVLNVFKVNNKYSTRASFDVVVNLLITLNLIDTILTMNTLTNFRPIFPFYNP